MAAQSKGVDILYQPQKLDEFGSHKIMSTFQIFSKISGVHLGLYSSRAELGTVGFGSNTLLRSSNSARARVEFEINVRIRLVKNLAKFELGSNSVRFTSRDFNRARAARARLEFL